MSLATVPFRNFGNELRPIILSNETLRQQTASTGVPNRPSDSAVLFPLEETFAPLTLLIEAFAPGFVRLRLASANEPARQRDYGILAPGALEQLEALQLREYREDTNKIVLVFDTLEIQLQRDPFDLRLTSRSEEHTTTFTTALDDRDVFGLLCTPPPGLLTPPETRAEAFWSWALDPDEHFYGLGERFDAFDHRGRTSRLWVLDAWGTTTAASYKCVPFLLSSRHYGLFFHTSTPVTFELGTSSARSALVRSGSSVLDLFVFFGATPKTLLAQYTQLTGRAPLPPRWVFGTWLSRCRYQNRAEVERVAKRARAEQVPCDVLHIDPAWLRYPNLSCDFVSNDESFPDLPGMIKELGEQGFKISLWELPYISAQSPHYQIAATAGYLLHDSQGQPISVDISTPHVDGYQRALVDLTNSAARSWWQDLHRPWLRAGVEIFKTDFGEGVPLAAVAANGMTGEELHNLYPLLYQDAVSEVIAQEKGRPAMIWGRSGWAGIQRYPAQWGGDPKTDLWSMRSSLRGGLNLALSAPGIWSHDIGGFYGLPPTPELYIRWAQFGLLSPLARAHGTTPREPWEFGEEALAIFKRYAFLRNRLAPYLYSTAWEMSADGLPMLRPLLLEYPDDPATATIDDAYLLGANLLVAPIFSESREPVARTLYLPRDEWFDFWTDEHLTGGRFITRHAALDTIPLYVRAGTILPLGPAVEHLADSPPEDITLEIYPGRASSARLIWDASGHATELTLQPASESWRVLVTGEQQARWLVRWHTTQGIVEQDAGTGQSFSLEMA